jgi:hypothetical protein
MNCMNLMSCSTTTCQRGLNVDSAQSALRGVHPLCSRVWKGVYWESGLHMQKVCHCLYYFHRTWLSKSNFAFLLKTTSSTVMLLFSSQDNILYNICRYTIGSWGSSVSIVSDYGPDDQAVGVRFPAETKDFASSLCVQTGSGDHPASYPMGSGVLSLGVKRSWFMTWTTHPHLVPRSRMSRSYISSPPRCLHGV